MKRFVSRVCALLLCAALFCGGALADTAGLDWAAGAYLDGYEDVRFHMSAQLQSLTPYGEDTLAMMNALLSQLSVSARLTSGGADSEMNFCVAGEPVAGVTERLTENGPEVTSTLLPGRTLTGGDSALNALSGFEQQESQFDLYAAIRELEGCYQQLTDAILPYAEQKAANYNIKKIGSSRWSRIARLTPEQGAELGPFIAGVLGCGMDQAFRRQLEQMTYVKGFIVGLYQTEENGQDLAVYIKGSVVFPDGAQRAISFQWAFATDENGVRTDTYKFDMTKNKTPRDNREISGSCERTTHAQSLLLDSQSKAVIRDPETGVITTTTITHDLKGENGSAEGTASCAVRTALGDTASTTTTTFTPQLALTEKDGCAALSGTVHVEQTTGKVTHISADLLFSEAAADAFLSSAQTATLFLVADDRLPQSSLNQNMDFDWDEPEDYLVGEPPIGCTAYPVPEEEITVDLASASREDIDALVDEMTQRLAGSLLAAAAKLPPEASALIRDSLSDADWAAFLALLEE